MLVQTPLHCIQRYSVLVGHKAQFHNSPQCAAPTESSSPALWKRGANRKGDTPPALSLQSREGLCTPTPPHILIGHRAGEEGAILLPSKPFITV